MKQETNNEIDLLLRRLSRRQEVPVSDADLRIDSDHLDADELSAYAENALPAAARARYTEHVADCSKCREIVVQLSGSVPVVVGERDCHGCRAFRAAKVSREFLFADGFTLRGAGARTDPRCCDWFCSFPVKSISCADSGPIGTSGAESCSEPKYTTSAVNVFMILLTQQRNLHHQHQRVPLMLRQ